MNQTKKSMPNLFTVTLPGANAENPQDANNLFDVRFSQKNKNLGYQQDMPATQKIVDVKNFLGYGSKTHYQTMLKNPTRKLRPFVYPSMTVEQLKTLVTELKTADPAKKKILRRYALEKSKEAEKLAAQKKKLFADLARATRAKIRKNPPQIVESYRKRAPSKAPSALRDDTGTQRNVVIKRTFVMGIFTTRQQYNKQLRMASRTFYDSLPISWRREGFDLYMFYDFYPSNHEKVPKTLKRYNLPGKHQWVHKETGRLGPLLDKYEAHTMTRLKQQASPESGDSNQLVRSANDVELQVFNHLLNRENLEELYNAETGVDKDNQLQAIFHIPNHFTFSAHKRRFDKDSSYGSRSSYLFRQILSQNEAPKDCCVWQAIIDQMNNTRYPIPWTIEQMQEKTGLGNRIALHDPAQIAILEEKLIITHGKKKKLATPLPIGIVLHDMRLRTRRLPPYPANIKMAQQKQLIHLVMHNNHVYGFQSESAARDIMLRDISFFEAYLLEAEKERLRLEKVDRFIAEMQNEGHHIDGDEWPHANQKVCKFLNCEPTAITIDNLYEKAWNLFIETQHLQPDRSAIRFFLQEKFGLEPDCVRSVSVTSSVNKYLPRFKILEKLAKEYENKNVAPIPARGLEIKCAKLGIEPKDNMRVNANRERMRNMGLIVPEVSYDMRSTIAMDLETCSIQNTDGNFLVYSGRYRYHDWYGSGTTKSHAIVAQTESDLNGGLMWTLLQEWVQLRKQHDDAVALAEQKAEEEFKEELERIASEEGRLSKEECKEAKKQFMKAKNFAKRGLYVYAHNGSKFDAIAAIHSILANTTNKDDLPTDQLESNGKFISFTWKGLIFRDSCLITMSSLKSACTAWGLETSKGYLPHRYLQNCQDEAEVLTRLHGRTTWAALEPYMDWFGDADDTQLHTRKAGYAVCLQNLLKENPNATKRQLKQALKDLGLNIEEIKHGIKNSSTMEEFVTFMHSMDWEMWRKQQPVYKFWKENQDVEFKFLDLHDEYLAKDVDALWELCARMGTAFAKDFGSDIRTKCTLGSNAEHIWMHTLMKPIPKLQTKEQHDRWQQANRGGFCGALSQYDFTALRGLNHPKVIVTELRNHILRFISEKLTTAKIDCSSAQLASQIFSKVSNDQILSWIASLNLKTDDSDLLYSIYSSANELYLYGEQIYKVDITSLYPASSCPIKFETAAGVQEPLKDWYRSFPDASRGWVLYDFGGVEMNREHYEQLSNMHGLIRIEFDQSSLAFPFFLKKMEHKTFQTLAPVMQGEERFIIPHVRMAFDYGVKINLFDCEYVTETREIYKEYMDVFAQKKNGADAVIKELKKTPEDAWTQQQKDGFTKATYDRTVAKLFLNGLLGRNNMKIERPQTLLTRDYNDIVCLTADDEAFKGADISEILCGDGWSYRAKFKEGEYKDHVSSFNVCPYLSAYMLGYSKMLMQCSFQFIAKIDAQPLYTDTDSIAFSATPQQWQAYSDRFVPSKKTFGGMELEGEYHRLVTIGPKKYACIKDNGKYEWACNGLPARHNTQTDVLGKYLKVLGGEVVDADYFSINATTDFRLLHTTGASKKLRFISLKGAVENGSIRWWNTEQEFRDYASSITVIGWEDFTKKERASTTDTAQELQPINTLPAPSEPHNRKKRSFERFNPTREEQESYVYILTDVEDRGYSYVGFSSDPQARLLVHNSGSGDAITTRGAQWKIHSIYAGFTDRQHALRFEGLMKMYTVNSVADYEGIASNIISGNSEYSQVYRKSENKKIIKPFVFDNVAKSTIEKHDFCKAASLFNKNLASVLQKPQTYKEERVEYIDGENLKLLVAELNKYEIDKPTKPRKSMSNEERELDNIRLFKNYVLTLQKKVEVNNQGESFINVTYTRKSCGGRRYSIGDFSDEMGTAKKISYSLQGMYGILRRFLIGKWCHDIDIVNCIPTILLQIALEDGVPLKFRETLTYYILNRQECLEEIMEQHDCSKEDAKDAVIRTYNGGTFKKWAEDCEITINKTEPAPFLEDLKWEIDGMKTHILALPKYKTIRSACLRLKPDKSIDQAASDRSAFATICFKKEDEILQAIEESVNKDGWRTETLIYDGMPLYDRQMSLEPAMRRAEAHVLQKTGIHIELAEKPMFNENLTVQDVLSQIRNR
jgi:predicted GIY-YIG superfamily endonuclease